MLRANQGICTETKRASMIGLRITAPFEIHDGELDAFNTIATTWDQSVQTKNTGTLQRDWFFSQDETECVVRKTP